MKTGNETEIYTRNALLFSSTRDIDAMQCNAMNERRVTSRKFSSLRWLFAAAEKREKITRIFDDNK